MSSLISLKEAQFHIPFSKATLLTLLAKSALLPYTNLSAERNKSWCIVFDMSVGT